MASKEDKVRAEAARAEAVRLLTVEDPNWGTPEEQLVRATRALAWATLYNGDSGNGNTITVGGNR